MKLFLTKNDLIGWPIEFILLDDILYMITKEELLEEHIDECDHIHSYGDFPQLTGYGWLNTFKKWSVIRPSSNKSVTH